MRHAYLFSTQQADDAGEKTIKIKAVVFFFAPCIFIEMRRCRRMGENAQNKGVSSSNIF
jgi:hypothetical protein